jgi:hypothetical protein
MVIADDDSSDDEIGAKVKLAKADLTEREKRIPEITTGGEDEDVLCSSSSIFSTNLLPFSDSIFRTEDEVIVAIVFFVWFCYYYRVGIRKAFIDRSQ